MDGIYIKNMAETEKTFNQKAGVTKEDILELAKFFELKSVDEVVEIHGKTVIKVAKIKKDKNLNKEVIIYE